MWRAPSGLFTRKGKGPRCLEGKKSSCQEKETQAAFQDQPGANSQTIMGTPALEIAPLQPSQWRTSHLPVSPKAMELPLHFRMNIDSPSEARSVAGARFYLMHSNSIEFIILFFPSKGNWNSKQLNNLPKVTQGRILIMMHLLLSSWARKRRKEPYELWNLAGLKPRIWEDRMGNSYPLAPGMVCSSPSSSQMPGKQAIVMSICDMILIKA